MASLIARRLGSSFRYGKTPLSARSSWKLLTVPATQVRYTSSIPKDLKYSKEHYWIRSNPNGLSKLGATDFAQQQLGDIIFVDINEGSVEVNNEVGTIESVKAVAQIFAPVTLKSISVNSEVKDDPELVNQDPYNEGYLLEFKVGANFKQEYDDLLSPEEYQKLLDSGDN